MLATLLDEIPFPAAILNWPEGQPIKIASANPIFLNGGRDLSGLFEPAELQATCEELIRQAESADGNNYPSWKGPAPCKHHSGWEAGIKYLGKNETDTQVFLLTYKAPANTIFEPDYGQLLCQTHDLCAMCDREGQFQFISPAITTELGYKPEDLIGQVAFDFVYPDDLPRTREAFDRLQKELSVQIPPYRFRKKNGEWCWLQTMCTNIGALENSGGILVNATDITGLIEAQQNLKESNERYQLIYKAGKDALYDWDILNDQLYWGDGFFRVFGHETNHHQTHFADKTRLTHPADLDKNRGRWNEFLADNSQYSWTNEYRFLRADGEYVYVEETGYLIRNAEGKPVRMIGSLRDINESKLNELQQLVEDEINWLFKMEEPLETIMNKVVEYLGSFASFEIASLWLITTNQELMRQVAFHARSEQTQKAYAAIAHPASIRFGEGLAGKVWKSGSSELWDSTAFYQDPYHESAAINAGLKMLACLPIRHKNIVIGAMVVGSRQNLQDEAFNLHILEKLQDTLGADIKRKKQEEEMRLVFESAPDILAIVSPTGYFTRVNPAFCKLMGYTGRELTTHPFHYFLHADDLNPSKTEFSQTMNGSRNVSNFVNRFITKTGEHRWISWNSSDTFGEENLAFAYGRDITEIKELEELIDNTSKLARVGSWEINMADKHIFCSKITRQILELKDGQELRLNNKLEFVKESSRHIIRKLLQEAIFDKKPWDIEIEIRTAKAETRWVRIIGQASFHRGRCARIYGSIQDIHDKKLVQLQLEEANDRYERVSSATHDAIWDWDLVRSRVTWNDGLRKIFGYAVTPEGTDASIWEQKIHPDDFVKVRSDIGQAYSDPNKQVFETEFRFERLDGTYAYVSNKGTIIRNPKGEPVRMVGAMTDISHRKAYEESLKNLNNELKRINHELASSNAELEQFAFVASHDLQEPLRMITGFLTMLEKKYGPQLDEKANQYIYFAVDGAKRMRGIILDLLEYSRVGRMNTTREEVDCNQTIADIRQLLKTQLEEKSAVLTADKLPTLLTYKLPLQQVFQNLISNALKYGRPDVVPEIHVGCEETEENWRFSVKDNGIGIAEEFRKKIFVIFQRLHYTPDIPGTGMGLAIAKKIIDWQGGKIWVESTVGEGSTFYFTLPK